MASTTERTHQRQVVPERTNNANGSGVNPLEDSKGRGDVRLNSSERRTEPNRQSNADSTGIQNVATRGIGVSHTKASSEATPFVSVIGCKNLQLRNIVMAYMSQLRKFAIAKPRICNVWQQPPYLPKHLRIFAYATANICICNIMRCLGQSISKNQI